METKYFHPKEFKKLKPVETFPNENVIIAIVDGIETRCYKSAIATITKLSDTECKWHSLPIGYYQLSSSDGYYPSSLLTDVVGRNYDTDGKTELGRLTGFKIGNSVGTANCGISNPKAVKEILEENGWEVIIKLTESQENKIIQSIINR